MQNDCQSTPKEGSTTESQATREFLLWLLKHPLTALTTMIQEEITTLQNAQDRGILLYKSGSSYLISSRTQQWVPPGVETWLLHGDISIYNTCTTAWHENKRLLINKHRQNPNLASSDNIHETSDHDLLNQHICSHPALDSLKTESIDATSKWFIIATHWSQFNLYHWLFDSIGKLSIAAEVINIEDICVLLPEGFLFSTLLDSLRIQHKSYPRNLLLTGKLYYPSMPGRLGVVPHNVVKFMRERTSHIEGAGIDNVFIARRAGSKRHLANQDDVLEYLEKHISISAYYLEDYSFDQQIALFKSAKLVIGPHGAGFSWGAFSEGSDIFEIFPPDYENGCFKTVYSPYGNYGHHTCSQVSKKPKENLETDGNHHEGMHVDINCFKLDFESFLDS